VANQQSGIVNILTKGDPKSIHYRKFPEKSALPKFLMTFDSQILYLPERSELVIVEMESLDSKAYVSVWDIKTGTLKLQSSLAMLHITACSVDRRSGEILITGNLDKPHLYVLNPLKKKQSKFPIPSKTQYLTTDITGPTIAQAESVIQINKIAGSQLVLTVYTSNTVILWDFEQKKSIQLLGDVKDCVTQAVIDYENSRFIFFRNHFNENKHEVIIIPFAQ
jgi:hypothetical protein